MVKYVAVDPMIYAELGQTRNFVIIKANVELQGTKNVQRILIYRIKQSPVDDEKSARRIRRTRLYLLR